MNKKGSFACLLPGLTLLVAAGFSAPTSAFTQDFVVDAGVFVPTADPNDSPWLGSIDGFKHGTVLGLGADTAPFSVLPEVQAYFESLCVEVSGRNNDHMHDDPYWGPNIVVAFDTNQSSTQDPDLEDPFVNPDGSSITSDFDLKRPGSVFIVQENTFDLDAAGSAGDETPGAQLGGDGQPTFVERHDGCNDGVCDQPDDEAQGGTIVFDFFAPVSLDDIAVFDIDNESQDEMAWFRFFREGEVNPFATEIVTGAEVGGDNHALRLAFNGGSGYDDVIRLEVEFSSSGAIDQLRGSKEHDPPETLTSVDAPGTLALMLAPTLLVGARRGLRRRVASAIGRG